MQKIFSPVGRFSNSTNESGPVDVGCRPCTAGQYQETEMSIDCDECPTGFASDQLASTCDTCPLGYFAPVPGGRAKPCAQCSSGMYADAPSSADCKMCPPGGYTSENASSACLACPGGRFIEDDGTNSSLHDHVNDCKYCKAGKYLRNRTAHAWFCGDLLLGQSGLHGDPNSALRANLSGWTLVRALAPGGNRGHPATDDLAGTDIYGDPAITGADGGTWSVNFEEALPGYDMLLFMLGGVGNLEYENVHECGKKWVVLEKNQVSKQSSAVGGIETMQAIKSLRSSSSKLNFEYSTNMNNPDWSSIGEDTPVVDGEKSVTPVIHAKFGLRAGAKWQDGDTVYLEGGQPVAVGSYSLGIWQPGAGDQLSSNTAAGMYVFVGRRQQQSQGDGPEKTTTSFNTEWWCYPEEPVTGRQAGSANGLNNRDSTGTLTGRQNTCSVSIHFGKSQKSTKTVILPVPRFLNLSIGRNGSDLLWHRELHCKDGGYGWLGGTTKTYGFTFTSSLSTTRVHWEVTARIKGSSDGWNDVNLYVLCSVHDVHLYTDHDTESDDCIDCPAGRFETGPYPKNSCDACIAGRYSTASGSLNASSCQMCPLGMWQSEVSATRCRNCSAGRYGYQEGSTSESLAYEISETGCASCKTGSWQDKPGAKACKACPAGFVGVAPQIPSVALSGNGIGFTTPEEACMSCSRGFFDTGTNSSRRVLFCDACPPGFFSGLATSTGQTGSCLPCPAGKHACGDGIRDSQDSACCDCGQGRYQDETTGGKLFCKTCERGRFNIKFGSTISCEACGPGMYGDELGAGRTGAVRGVVLPPPPDRAVTPFRPLPSQLAPGAVPGLYAKYMDMWCEENGEGGPSYIESGVGSDYRQDNSRVRQLDFTMVSLVDHGDHWGHRGSGTCQGWSTQRPGTEFSVDPETGSVPASAKSNPAYAEVDSADICKSLCLEDAWCRYASFRSSDGRCFVNRGGLSGFVGTGQTPDVFFASTGTDRDRIECIRSQHDASLAEWETFKKVQSGVLNVGDKHQPATTSQCLRLCNSRPWCRSVVMSASVNHEINPVPWSCQLTARCTVDVAIGTKWRSVAPAHYPLSNDGYRHNFFSTDLRVWMYVKDAEFYASGSRHKIFRGRPSDFMLAHKNLNPTARLASFDLEVRPSPIDGEPYVHSVNVSLGGSGYSLEGHPDGIEFVVKPSLFASKLGASESRRWEGLLEYPETWVGVEDTIHLSQLQKSSLYLSRSRNGINEPALSTSGLFSEGDTVVTYPEGREVGVVSDVGGSSTFFVRNASSCVASAIAELGAEAITRSTVTRGSWGHVPYGCTVNNGVPHWNDQIHGQESHSGFERVGSDPSDVSMKSPGTLLSVGADGILITRAFTIRVTTLQNNAGCKKCEAGRYNDQQQHFDNGTTAFLIASSFSACKLCPKGRWDNEEGMKSADSAQYGCNACLPGQYGTEEGCINPAGTKIDPSLVSINRDGLGSWSCVHACAFCPAGYFSEGFGMSSNATCKSCPPGMYVERAGATSRGECVACPAGKYGMSSVEGSSKQHPCKDCPTGRFVVNSGTMGAINCTLCPSGRFGPKTGSSEEDDCELCPRGTFSSLMGRFREEHCEKCPKGRIGKFRGLVAISRDATLFLNPNVTSDPHVHCIDCFPGFFVSLLGSSECTPVTPGFYASNHSSTEEYPCPQGTYSVAGVKDRCQGCPKGRYNELIQQPSVDRCLECPEGTYLNTIAATAKRECKSCGRGYFTPTTGNTDVSDCRACASGQFQDTTGQTGCKDCARGKSQIAEASVGCNDCEKGMYQSNFKSSQCTTCEPGRFQTELGMETCSLCPDGFFQSEPSSDNCSMCAVGFFMGCPGGFQCWECEIGRTSEPLEGGVRCVAETLPTVEPIISSPGTGGVYSPGKDPQHVPNVLCIDFRIPNEKERATLDASLPYRFSNGFMVEWSIERGFPPPNEEALDERQRTNWTMFYPKDYGDLSKHPLHELLVDRGMEQKPVDTVHGPWSFCINTSIPLHLEELYVRVRGVGPILNGIDDVAEQQQDEGESTALGTPSQTTPGFSTARECGDVMYLSQSSYPPKGPGGWTIGAYNADLGNWRCDPCPTGADCRGNTRWVDIYAKFGYFRLDSHDFDTRETSFWKCFKPLACLGGKNPVLERKYIWLTEKQERPSWPNVTVDGRQVDTLPPEDREDIPMCCSALDPLVDDLPACRENPPLNGPGVPCNVDLAKVDDFEGCNEEAGYALKCPASPTGKCRLCRKCADGWWEQGVSTCLRCPPLWVNILAPIFAGGMIAAMMFVFLSSALSDSSAEAHSSVVHLSQPMQKILLNHAQLVSLASGFPLAWPDAVQEMFTAMGVLGQAGSYMFNPACNGVELVEGESMFFQKQLGILMLPFIAVICSVIFWLAVACHKFVLDMREHPEDRRERIRREKAEKKKLDEEKRVLGKKKKAEKKRRRETLKKEKKFLREQKKAEKKKKLEALKSIKLEKKKMKLQIKSVKKITVAGDKEEAEDQIRLKENEKEAGQKDLAVASATIGSVCSDIASVKAESRMNAPETRPKLTTNGIEMNKVEKIADTESSSKGIQSPAAKTKKKRQKKKNKRQKKKKKKKKEKKIEKEGDSHTRVGILGKVGDSIGNAVHRIEHAIENAAHLSQSKLADNGKKSLAEIIHDEMRANAEAAMALVTFKDKCIATIVTVLYLIYPTVVKSTFLLVACAPVGKNFYLQMDLDIECYEEEHMFWVLHLFLPCFLGYVVGLPAVAYLILNFNKEKLNNRTIRFRYGTLFTGYTDKCYYWEGIVAMRKAAVLAISVFLTNAGAEAQALSAVMVIMLSLIMHLHWAPFVRVDEKHNTLFWSEFCALFVAFVTFWTGLFFYQEVAKEGNVQKIFTIELLTLNVLFCLMSIRWFLILKLMDIDDQIQIDELKGEDEKKIQSAKKLRNFLKRIVPEWRKLSQLWTKRAWKILIRKQIIKNRAMKIFNIKDLVQLQIEKEKVKQPGSLQKRFSLSTHHKLHKEALDNLFKTSDPTPLSKRISNAKKVRKKLARGRSWRQSLAESLMARKKLEGDGALGSDVKSKVIPITSVGKTQDVGRKHKVGTVVAVHKAKEQFLQTKMRRREKRRRQSKEKMKKRDVAAGSNAPGNNKRKTMKKQKNPNLSDTVQGRAMSESPQENGHTKKAMNELLSTKVANTASKHPGRSKSKSRRKLPALPKDEQKTNHTHEDVPQ